MSELTKLQETPRTKSIFSSKTFWVNLIMIVLAILAITEPQVIGIDPSHLIWITGVLNIFLRFLTNGAVTVTGGKK